MAPEFLQQIFECSGQFPGLLRLKQVCTGWSSAIDAMPAVLSVDVLRYLKLDFTRNIAQQMETILKSGSKAVENFETPCFEYSGEQLEYVPEALQAIARYNKPDKLRCLRIDEEFLLVGDDDLKLMVFTFLCFFSKTPFHI